MLLVSIMVLGLSLALARTAGAQKQQKLLSMTVMHLRAQMQAEGIPSSCDNQATPIRVTLGNQFPVASTTRRCELRQLTLSIHGQSKSVRVARQHFVVQDSDLMGPGALELSSLDGAL